jgi:hypothetical protein
MDWHLHRVACTCTSLDDLAGGGLRADAGAAGEHTIIMVRSTICYLGRSGVRQLTCAFSAPHTLISGGCEIKFVDQLSDVGSMSSRMGRMPVVPRPSGSSRLSQDS